MDAEILASALGFLIREAVPQLQEWGSKATEKALESYVGEKAKQVAQGFKLLKPKIEEKPLAEASLKELAAQDPGGEEAALAEEILKAQLRMLLTSDETLCVELLEQLEGVEVRPSAGGVVAGRDVRAENLVTGGHVYKITGGTVTIVHGDAVASAPETPESPNPQVAYLSWVMARTGRLALGGVDPAVGREQDRRLHLDAVYTALLTRTPRREDGEGVGGKAGANESEMLRRASGRQDESPLSALEQLDLHQYLVLLGDPGSGKSTFVDFLALCLAGELHPEAQGTGLDLLRAPVPQDDGSDGESPQPWSHGALLPVHVVLRDFAASKVFEETETPAAEALWTFLKGELERARQADFAPALEAKLKAGEALVLLDGLDEVPEAARRRVMLCRTVECFMHAYSGCRFLVTSRTYAYQEQDFHLEGFAVAQLAPFADGQIRRFIRRWYAEVAGLKGLDEDDAQGRAALLEQAVFGSSQLRELAERPLLLTLMASLHAFRGGSLPRERERLYQETVELLLDVWEQKRYRRDASGQLLQEEPSLTEWLRVERRDVLRVLQELAYEVHSRQEGLVGTADVPAGDLISRLMGLRASAGESVDPVKLAVYLSQRSGILDERGPRVYTFPHRTFQEYLAARHLVDGGFDYDDIARDARHDPNRWREVILLAAARIGPLGVWELADALAFEDETGEPQANAWGLHLAGHAVAESANLEQMSKRHRRRLGQLQERLAALLVSSELPAEERALAGEHLARLGDPRFDAEAWYLPVDPTAGFLAIAGGEYLIGSDTQKDPDAIDTEQPQHRVQLSPFWLARCPVTVAQFQAFVTDSGFEIDYPPALTGIGNHPVVEVTWDEARAYCDWLTARLHQIAPECSARANASPERRFWEGVASGALRVTLPTEAQWEAAARGAGAWLYPWGDEAPTREHANYGGGIQTSSVGIYPQGQGPFGNEDQAGNVWEWCADVWNEEAYAKRGGEAVLDPITTEGDKALRVLRGGSWASPALNLRAACRNWDWHWDGSGSIGFRVCVSGPEHA